jgi:hypothetical protein
MLISLCSSKGAPGTTSTALALAAAWPRPVVLLEADPAGGDLAYRCQSASGGPLAASPSVLSLASAAGSASVGSVAAFSQQLACGVSIVQGVGSPAQSRGLASLWGTIAQMCRDSDVDVIADLGRFDRSSPTLPVAAGSDRLLVVASAALDSLMHTRATITEIAGAITRDPTRARPTPVLVGPARHARGHRDDSDRVMAAAGDLAGPTAHVPLDRPALARLENGEAATKLRKTILMRAVTSLAVELSGAGTEVNA